MDKTVLVIVNFLYQSKKTQWNPYIYIVSLGFTITTLLINGILVVNIWEFNESSTKTTVNVYKGKRQI